ncbi:cadherin-like protein 26 [Rhea pennata]|uniref:cadherin-like protein 26 n=1 Tax=Rhea pennata TaxID=8795 RepID=UPI002E2729C5
MYPEKRHWGSQLVHQHRRKTSSRQTGGERGRLNAAVGLGFTEEPRRRCPEEQVALAQPQSLLPWLQWLHAAQGRADAGVLPGPPGAPQLVGACPAPNPVLRPYGATRCAASPGANHTSHSGLLFYKVTAANTFSHEVENFHLGQAIQKKTTQWLDPYQLDGLHPLRRTKRTWVITTIVVQEEEKGPFPKYAGQLFNNKAFNASVRYLISGPGVDEYPEIGLFSIEDDVNGHVYVHRTIDREKTPSFQVRFDVVHRKNAELLDRPLFFKIKVKDVNDNAPEFSKKEFNITIRENHSKDEPVFQVTASDKDEGGTDNSQVSYSLIMQMPILDGFTYNIDPTTGLILLSGCLNYEIASFFKLLVEASDHGVPQQSSTATVNVAIEDANNHLPVFINDHYQLQISAGQEHPAALRLQVEDKDSANTPAWRAKYNITKGNEKKHFAIMTDPETNDGILSIVKPLIFEENSEKRLVISVENEEPFFSCKNGKVMISSTESMNVTVNIKVLKSQHAPQFHPPILVVQKEDPVKPGTVFRRYLAKYPDNTPRKIKYELAHDPAGWVKVNENSGVLTVAKEFDQESPYVNDSLYTIIVQAVDDGIPPQTGTGTILLYLSDINDRMPALVTPSLDLCDQKERTPLIIKAKSALVQNVNGPFTFELAEDSEDVKHNWKLGRNFGESVELLMLRRLPQGSYLVPFIIQDGQGFSTRQNQHVRLCVCPDGYTCADSPRSQVRLGGNAIAVMLIALLLLLVSSILLCRFYASGSKGKASLPPQEGEQTLITYNEENRKPLSQAKLDTTDYVTLLPVSTEVGKVTVKDGLYTRYNKTSQTRYLHHTLQTVDKILDQKLCDQNRLEDDGHSYEPCIYAEEGEPERSSSFHSLSIVSEELPWDFLQTLGPKFSALDKICQ